MSGDGDGSLDPELAEVVVTGPPLGYQLVREPNPRRQTRPMSITHVTSTAQSAASMWTAIRENLL
jgi:hypothetical protein